MSAQPAGPDAAMPRAGTREYAFLAATGAAPPLVETPGLRSGLGLRKFRDRLVLPPLIQAWLKPEDTPVRVRAQVARTRFHRDLPEVDVWSYEGSSPGPTIEVRRDREVLIDWVNDLGHHGHTAHLPYDVVRVPPIQNAPGFNGDVRAAATPGGRATDRGAGPDSYPRLAHTEHLTGQTVVHLHGALTDGHNDGWAHNVSAPGGVTRCLYPNRQPAATLWYHDHAMAVTRFNVYAGLAGFYLIRDDVEEALRLPAGEQEIPLMIADRNLETSAPEADSAPAFTGRFLYKQAGFSFAPGPQAPVSEIPVTGPFALVNGKIWPTHRVTGRWHRLRIVNASNARVLRLALHDTTDEVFAPDQSVPAGDPAFGARRVEALVVIGTDGGLLPAPWRPPGGVIEFGPGERLDLLVDFAPYTGRKLELRNENGTALNAQPGQSDASLMQFVVDPRPFRDPWQLPATLNPEYARWAHLTDGTLDVGEQVIAHHEHVWVGVIPPGTRGGLHPELWELAPVSFAEGEAPADHDRISITQHDGTVLHLRPVAKLFDDATTIVLPRGSWAVWHLLHLGGPDHPIHIHMAQFQMLARRQWPITGPGGSVPQYDPATGTTHTPLPPPDPGRPIDAATAGMKDTWVLKAGEWVSVLGHFEGASGSFMYHCHILDHEDVTMMRPFVVLPPELLAFHGAHGGGHH